MNPPPLTACTWMEVEADKSVRLCTLPAEHGGKHVYGPPIYFTPPESAKVESP